MRSYDAELPAPFQFRLTTRVYAVFVGFLLFAASDPIYPTLMRGPSEWVLAAPGLETARRLAWLCIYSGMLILLWTMRKSIPRALDAQSVFFVAMGYFILSSLWSSNPVEGIIGGVQALFTITFGIVVGTRLGSEGILRAFFCAGLLAVAFTLVFVIAFPDHAFGFRYNTGALRGVYVEKNHLALFLSYSVWAAVFMWLSAPRSVPLLGFALLTLALCLLTVSSIAVLQITLIAGAVLFTLLTRNMPHRGLYALVMVVSMVVFMILVLPEILDVLGEDMTFNGRTTLWAYLWDFIERRPVFGYGYRGFWASQDAEHLRAVLGWPAKGAHNVWMQAMVFGGLIGLILWIALWWRVVVRACVAFSQGHNLNHVAMSVLIFITLLWSLFETTQLQHFSHNGIVTGIALAARGRKFN